jgi:hypothetical protein
LGRDLAGWPGKISVHDWKIIALHRIAFLKKGFECVKTQRAPGSVFDSEFF